MILSDVALKKLIFNEELLIEPYEEEQIGPSSIDLRLGNMLCKYTSSIIEIGKTIPAVDCIDISPKNGYTLKPKEFILGCTLERVIIPNGYQGFIETKGDIARAGIQVHNGDGHIDPGFNGVITLEIVNNNTIPIVLYPHTFICQIFIFELSSSSESPYRGKYQGQTQPTPYFPK